MSTMSVSSEEVYYCTSSSSSSSSCDSSCSTGNFSSTTLDSRASTIIANQPCVRPFGCPDYSYFWIENKSKTNPKLSYYYNFKSQSVVWERPVPKDIPLPYYPSCWNSDPKPPTDDEDEDLVVSEEEDQLQKKKRLDIKRRNRQLLREGKLGVTQPITCKKTMSKKKFRTLWKLLRNPGETEEDVKKRLFESDENGLVIKTEDMSEDAQNNLCNPQEITIKKEPEFFNDDVQIAEDPFQDVKPASESDSDPEHVSYLIKREYMMHYSDSEMENDDEKEEIPEDLEKSSQTESDFEENESDEQEDDDYQEYMDQGSDAELENAIDFTSGNRAQESGLLMDVSDDEGDMPISDFVTVVLDESSGGNVLHEFDQSNDMDTTGEVNWMFNSSRRVENPLLTVNNPELHHPHSVPKLKQISKKHLASRKRKKKTAKNIQSKPCTKEIPVIDVKDTERNDDGPIVCDMYGTRTINYNHPPKMKIPKWQSRSRLSDNSDSSDFEADGKLALSPSSSIHNNKQADALELKNWFPKAQKRRKMRRRKDSLSSWCDSEISAYSDVDEYVKNLVRMKKEKRSSSPNVSKQSDSSSIIETLDSTKNDDVDEKLPNGEHETIANEEKCIILESKAPEDESSRVKDEKDETELPSVHDGQLEKAIDSEELEWQFKFSAMQEDFMKNVEKRREEWQKAVAAVENEDLENDTAPVDHQVLQVSLEALAEVELQKAIETLANQEPEYITPDLISDFGEILPDETPKVLTEPFDINETPDMISGLTEMFPDDLLKVSEEPLDISEIPNMIPDVEKMIPDLPKVAEEPFDFNETPGIISSTEEILTGDLFKVSEEPLDISENPSVIPRIEENLTNDTLKKEDESHTINEGSSLNNSESFSNYRTKESMAKHTASSSSSSCGSSCSCGSSSSSSDGDSDSDSDEDKTGEKKEVM